MAECLIKISGDIYHNLSLFCLINTSNFMKIYSYIERLKMFENTKTF